VIQKSHRAHLHAITREIVNTGRYRERNHGMHFPPSMQCVLQLDKATITQSYFAMIVYVAAVASSACRLSIGRLRLSKYLSSSLVIRYFPLRVIDVKLSSFDAIFSILRRCHLLVGILHKDTSSYRRSARNAVCHFFFFLSIVRN